MKQRVRRKLLLLGASAVFLLALWRAGSFVWRCAPRPSAPEGQKAALQKPGGEERPARPESILVDDFEVGRTSGLFAQRKNRLDAFQGTWARRPSYTVITKVLDTRPGTLGQALRIEYNKVGGWCGWYTLLNGIDVSRHNALSFWVKGEEGGERFDIGMADERMQELEIDANYVGPITAFLPEGVKTQWQQVKIPLAPLRSEMDMTRMGSLVFWFRYEGAGAIHVDDIAFVYDEEVERILEQNLPRVEPDPRAPRAMWVWKYDPVNQPDVRKELFEFCDRTAIRRLYLYLGEEPVTDMSEDNQERLARFLRQAHSRGLEIHALQGNPLWALKPYHPRVLAWIGGFLEYNAARAPQEWIDGVHMDIEPYLTSEWETGDRDRLKAEFLELLAGCRALIDRRTRDLNRYYVPQGVQVPGTDQGLRPWALGPTAEKPFVMGLAIPLFYNREPEMEAKLLEHLDYAALMDYYDAGADIIQHGRFHLGLAEELGVEMVVGVETQDLVEMKQGKRRNTFIEEGWEEMERQLNEVVEAFAGIPSFGGLAIHCYYAYKVMQRGRNVPTRERSGKVPGLVAREAPRPVAVDGVLSEWEEAEWIEGRTRDDVVYGVGAWEGPDDFSYRLATQWEPEALVLAFDVTDDVHWQEKQGAEMWEGDHIELWIDVDLEGDYSEAANSGDDFQIGLSPGNFGDLAPEVHVWVPTVAPESLKDVELAAKKTDAGYAMEVRLPTAFLFQKVEKRVGVEPLAGGQASERLSPGQLALQRGVLGSGKLQAGFRLGMMADPSDGDSQRHPQKLMMSTSKERQWGDPTTFNILELK